MTHPSGALTEAAERLRSVPLKYSEFGKHENPTLVIQKDYSKHCHQRRNFVEEKKRAAIGGYKAVASEETQNSESAG